MESLLGHLAGYEVAQFRLVDGFALLFAGHMCLQDLVRLTVHENYFFWQHFIVFKHQSIVLKNPYFARRKPFTSVLVVD